MNKTLLHILALILSTAACVNAPDDPIERCGERPARPGTVVAYEGDRAIMFAADWANYQAWTHDLANWADCMADR